MRVASCSQSMSRLTWEACIGLHRGARPPPTSDPLGLNLDGAWAWRCHEVYKPTVAGKQRTDSCLGRASFVINRVSLIDLFVRGAGGCSHERVAKTASTPTG